MTSQHRRRRSLDVCRYLKVLIGGENYAIMPQDWSSLDHVKLSSVSLQCYVISQIIMLRKDNRRLMIIFPNNIIQCQKMPKEVPTSRKILFLSTRTMARMVPEVSLLKDRKKLNKED